MSTAPALPSLSLATPHTCVLDNFKLSLAEHVSKILGVELQAAYESVESGKVGKSATGDFTVAVPRFRLKGDINALAQRLVDELPANGHYIASGHAKGPFVTFLANTTTITQAVLTQVNEMTWLRPDVPSLDTLSLDTPAPVVVVEEKKTAGGERVTREPKRPIKYGYGMNQDGNGKNIIVEFSSPNISKVFHVGHLRSTIIGAFLGNLYEANGYSVTRMNYLGDWGKQFGILAVGYRKYGSDELLERDAIMHLYDVYVKIWKDGETDETVHDKAREFFKAMEDGDEESLALWRKFRDLSIVKYKDAYARLNVHFDVYSGESTVSHAAQTAALETLTKTGLVTESDGALVVDLDAYKLARTVVRKKDGTYVYITRDIAGAIERWEEYGFDKMIYVVATQQDLHMAQFFKVLELMGYPWRSKIEHVNFGMVLGMSTRKGTVVFLDDILNEAKDVMHEQMKSNPVKYAGIEDPEYVSDTLGITAVKIQDMAAKRVGNYKFEWKRMTSFEGDTGPYLQYAHARLCSVERKNAPDLVLPPYALRPTTINTSLLVEPKARDIILLMALYPDVVKSALKGLEPSTIVTFCFRLTHAISSAWETLIVKGQEREVAMARLWLYVSARDVLASAMRLLTLDPLQKM